MSKIVLYIDDPTLDKLLTDASVDTRLPMGEDGQQVFTMDGVDWKWNPKGKTYEADFSLHELNSSSSGNIGNEISGKVSWVSVKVRIYCDQLKVIFKDVWPPPQSCLDFEVPSDSIGFSNKPVRLEYLGEGGKFDTHGYYHEYIAFAEFPVKIGVVLEAHGIETTVGVRKVEMPLGENE